MADFLNPAHTLDGVSQRFAQFARIEGGNTPLYECLARRVADDPDVLALAVNIPSGQPIAPLFFAAVHFLLLERLDHPLARFYPNLCENAPAPSRSDPYPTFRDFCVEHGDEIRHIGATRRVQTNEVRRCATFLPAVALLDAQRPLAWIEAGTSAGLNLNWPLYHYSYSDGRSVGDPASAVRLTCELRGERPPLPPEIPELAFRVGIDLHPVRLDREQEARWLQALVWPDQVARFARLRAAIAMWDTHPADVREGDAFTLLPDIVMKLDGDLQACVIHSYMLNQFSMEARLQFEQMLLDLSHARPITRLFIEWLDGGSCPLLELHTYDRGFHREGSVLASCHWHGEWLRWE